jgi:DNA-binding HxlR family transcriptional regulator
MKKGSKDTSEIEFLTRSPCPITNALELIGDKWTLIVIRDLFLGKKTYGDFQNSPEGIPTNILAERLKRLERGGIIEKRPYQEKPIRYEYHLTTKGKDLGNIVKAVKEWGLKHIKGTSTKLAEEYMKQQRK